MNREYLEKLIGAVAHPYFDESDLYRVVDFKYTCSKRFVEVDRLKLNRAYRSGLINKETLGQELCRLSFNEDAETIEIHRPELIVTLVKIDPDTHEELKDANNSPMVAQGPYSDWIIHYKNDKGEIQYA